MITKLQDKIFQKTILIILAFTAIAVMSRLLPHMYNFTPIVGMALFLSFRWNQKVSIIFVLLSMLISDFFIGFDSLEMRLVVYGSFLVPSLLGVMIKDRKSFSSKYFTIFATAFGSSIIFFITTNFDVWLESGMYPHTFDGLILCYIMALPFFKNSILGDLFSSFFIFGVYDLLLLVAKKGYRFIIFEK